MENASVKTLNTLKVALVAFVRRDQRVPLKRCTTRVGDRASREVMTWDRTRIQLGEHLGCGTGSVL